MQIGSDEKFLSNDKSVAISEVVEWFSKAEKDSENPEWRKSYPYGISQLLSERGYAKSVYCDVIEHFASLHFTTPNK